MICEKYPGGQKYERDEEKREIAVVFREYLDRVREDSAYETAKREHQAAYADE